MYPTFFIVCLTAERHLQCFRFLATENRVTVSTASVCGVGCLVHWAHAKEREHAWPHGKFTQLFESSLNDLQQFLKIFPILIGGRGKLKNILICLTARYNELFFF